MTGMDHSSPGGSEPEEQIPRSGDGARDRRSPRVRSRRPRYASRACKECKRRKVKCSGETPCYHCRRHEVQCLYSKHMSSRSGKLSEMAELRQQLETLQQHVSFLVSREKAPEPPANIQALAVSDWLRSPQSVSDMQIPSLSPIQQQQLSVGQSFPKPRSVQNIGSKNSTPSHLSGTGAASLLGNDVTEVGSTHHLGASANGTSASGRLAIACHPLLSLSHAEAMRLVDVYEDECGSVYPLIDIVHLRNFATEVYESVTVSTNPTTWRAFKLDQSSKRHFNTLEIVLAIALVIEGHGATHLSSALMDELEAEIDHRPSGVSADTHLAEILTLMSFYQFYRDEEVLAWRTIGLAARIALEIGLHLNDPPFTTFQSVQERELANRLFWCIYCLDRRWSFGTGLPFGIQEDDIDPSLQEPVDSYPYLFTSIIAHSRIGSKILKAFSGSDHLELSPKREETAFLKYQVQQWYNSLIPELRIEQDQELVLESLSPARNRLRVLNCLRKNQLLMMIHRRTLYTEASIISDPQGARVAVDLAKSTISLLDRLGKTSEVYRSHAACFNYFLYSTLTVILLAAYHAKAQFHEYCRKELHMALNLIGGISAKSNIAKKLWKIIKHLKVTIPDTGILHYMETQQDNLGQQQEPQSHANPAFQPEHTRTLPGASQGQLFANTSLAPPQTSTYSLPMTSSGGNSTVYGDSGNAFCTSGDYAVDGSLLSSELSDLFQAIDPTRCNQAPLQLFDTQQQQQHQSSSQPQPHSSGFQLPRSFARDIRIVF